MGIQDKIRKKLQENRQSNLKIRLANKVIREKSRVAGLKEKERQAIRLAIEKQKLKADAKINRAKRIQEIRLNQRIKQIQNPQPSFGDFANKVVVGNTKKKSTKKNKKPTKKNKKSKKSSRRRVTTPNKALSQTLQPHKFDVLGI